MFVLTELMLITPPNCDAITPFEAYNVFNLVPPEPRANVYKARTPPFKAACFKSPYAIPAVTFLHSLTTGHVFEPATNPQLAYLPNPSMTSGLPTMCSGHLTPYPTPP